MRRAAHLELALAPRAPGVPRQGWLYAEIRAAVHAGRLAPGARLPPSRDFARQLRGAIDVRGTGGVGFDVGALLGAGKDIIRGQMNE